MKFHPASTVAVLDALLSLETIAVSQFPPIRRYLAYQNRDPRDTSQQRNFAHYRSSNSY
jgi:hypothetical protein